MSNSDTQTERNSEMNITEWTDLIDKAKKGSVEAHYNLGLIFRDGTEGSQDYVLALMWFLIVIELSRESSIQKLAIKERDNIKNYHLTPSLIELGSTYASKWIATYKKLRLEKFRIVK